MSEAVREFVEVGDKTFCVDRREDSLWIYLNSRRGAVVIMSLERASTGKTKLWSRAGNYSFDHEQLQFILDTCKEF